MQSSILDSLYLVDLSGHIIIVTILVTLIAGIATSLALRARYASIEKDLSRNPTGTGAFSHAVLDHIVRQSRQASRHQTAPFSSQAIVEQSFQSELKGALLGERFVRSSIGLMIILGLVGTFYGLSSSIGRLVHLVTSDAPSDVNLGQVLTQGLSQALSGMSVAFTTSLFGILAAIIMMLFSIFSNVTDRRTALMVRIETYVDQLVSNLSPAAPQPSDQRLEGALTRFGQSVAQLDETVARFDTALQTFAATTRDFREFNLHLKDNIQRMSLSFGDFSEAMKTEVGTLKSQSRS